MTACSTWSSSIFCATCSLTYCLVFVVKGLLNGHFECVCRWVRREVVEVKNPQITGNMAYSTQSSMISWSQIVADSVWERWCERLKYRIESRFHASTTSDFCPFQDPARLFPFRVTTLETSNSQQPQLHLTMPDPYEDTPAHSTRSKSNRRKRKVGQRFSSQRPIISPHSTTHWSP